MQSAARPTPGSAPARVVVTDDSGFMRRIIASGLEKKGHTIIGEARDGDEALALCEKLSPDVLTLDLAMPGLDGLGVLRAMRKAGKEIPVVVVSAFSAAQGARAVDALAEGAFELAPKPAVGQPLSDFIYDLDAKVRLAKASRRQMGVRPRTRPAARAPQPVAHVQRLTPATGPKVVAIACSTGGPKALARLVPQLPSPLGAGGFIVQHMPAGFTASLAQRLDRDSRLTVKEAAGGEQLAPNTLLMAPGGSHLRLDADRARLSDEAPIGALRPRADLSIVDVAKRYGSRTVLVVLTGMGKDGLDGAREVRRQGGRILVEAEETCTVYGMPRAVAEAGLADVIAPLDDLPAAIAAEVRS